MMLLSRFTRVNCNEEFVIRGTILITIKKELVKKEIKYEHS